MGKLIKVLIVALFLSACDKNDDTTLNISDNSFSYFETESFDDYFGNSQFLLYDLSANKTFKIELGQFRQTLWVDSKLVYSDGYSILKYDPRTRETIYLFESTDQIQYFDYSDQKIAYSDYHDIYVYDLITKTTSNVTEHIEGEFKFPNLSPDGKSILFNSIIEKVREGDIAPTTTTQFMIYHLETQEFQGVKMFDEFASPHPFPDWSPDSKTILYEQYEGIFTFDIDNEELIRLTNESTVAHNPIFSPDGTMISYLKSTQSASGINWQNFLTIYFLDNRQEIVVNDVNSHGPSWNSESNTIIFTTDEGIYSYNLSTKALDKLIGAKTSTFLHKVQWINNGKN